ncbi:hypothetical protein HA402_015605 [Bradysia odoriphaga]|nr:hypothetical protein HA402_015605 [Bradysia odoriphaga]
MFMDCRDVAILTSNLIHLGSNPSVIPNTCPNDISISWTYYVRNCGLLLLITSFLFVRHKAIQYKLTELTTDIEFLIIFLLAWQLIIFTSQIAFNSYFHLNDNEMQVLDSPELIEHYFIDVEGMKVESNGKINYVEGHVVNRSDPALYTWYPKNENVGHASLQLSIDDAYLSYWPGNIESKSILEETMRGIQRNLSYDIRQEGCLPDHVIIFKPSVNLSQEKILEWHRRNSKKDDSSYHPLVENCIRYPSMPL